MFLWTPQLDAIAPPRRGQGPPVSQNIMGRVRMFRSALKARAVGYEPRESLVRLMRTGEGDLADEADAFLLACSAPRRGTGVGKIQRALRSGGNEGRVCRRRCVGHAARHFRGRRDLLARRRVAAGSAVSRRARAHARGDSIAALARARRRLRRRTRVRRAAIDGLPHGMLGWRTSTGYDACREAIAYLFPDHWPFFARAADELRAHRVESSLLLGAITNRDEHDRIGDFIGDADLDRNALVVARELREEGEAVLVRHARRVVRRMPRSSKPYRASCER